MHARHRPHVERAPGPKSGGLRRFCRIFPLLAAISAALAVAVPAEAVAAQAFHGHKPLAEDSAAVPGRSFPAGSGDTPGREVQNGEETPCTAALFALPDSVKDMKDKAADLAEEAGKAVKDADLVPQEAKDMAKSARDAVGELTRPTPPEPPFLCVFEKDSAPSLDENSPAHALFLKAGEQEQAAQAIAVREAGHTRESYAQMRNDKAWEPVFPLYQKAADAGHWQAECTVAEWLYHGKGTAKDTRRAEALLDSLMQRGVPRAFYLKGTFAEDRKEGAALRSKAAELGYPPALYEQGKKRPAARGLAFMVCAVRQGYAPASEYIADILREEGNIPLAAEYNLRAGGQGSLRGLLFVEVLFHEKGTDPRYDYAPAPALTQKLAGCYMQLQDNPLLRFPSLGKTTPLPVHPVLGDGRALPSKLKEACGGRWPDEVWPDMQKW